MDRCAPWSSMSPGAPLRAAELPDPGAAAPARCCSRSARAGSAAPTCTSATARSAGRAAGRPRPPDRRHGARRGGRRGPRAGRARRGPVARLDRRHVPVLHARAREPLRARALHRPGPRRRLRRARGRRRALLPSPLPDGFGDLEVAPLLCAGLIGHRALRMTGDAQRLGLYGFGAARTSSARSRATRAARLRVHPRRRRRLAGASRSSWGCEWAGDALGPPPEELDAAIIFAPAGELVPAALRAVGRGGVVVCAGIHMSDIPSFPYA